MENKTFMVTITDMKKPFIKDFLFVDGYLNSKEDEIKEIAFLNSKHIFLNDFNFNDEETQRYTHMFSSYKEYIKNLEYLSNHFNTGWFISDICLIEKIKDSK